MRILLPLLLLPLLMACPKPTPPGPVAPEEEIPSEVRDTMPFDGALVKRFRADLGLKSLDRPEAIGEAWEEFKNAFSACSPKTGDAGFAAFLDYMQNNIRRADARKGTTYDHLLGTARQGRPLDLERDAATRLLFNNLCALQLTGEKTLTIRPDWAALALKGGATVSDTVRSVLERLQLESGDLEKPFRTVPEAIAPLTCADQFDFWTGILYDASPEFPLRPLVRERYLLWLDRLLPAFAPGSDVSAYQEAWERIAEFWADTPEGAGFTSLAEEAAAANGVWNESLNADRKDLLNELKSQ
jgi:hypothetical protein